MSLKKELLKKITRKNDKQQYMTNYSREIYIIYIRFLKYNFSLQLLVSLNFSIKLSIKKLFCCFLYFSYFYKINDVF